MMIKTYSLHLLLCCIPLFKANAQFAKGADIGWLSQMESSNRKFYDNTGKQQDLLDILKSKGINSLRLRVWVNPANGWCGKADVVKQAIRARTKGFRIMIDFHYSDSWADPGQQNKPAAWSGYSITRLKESVYNHTFDVLNTLKTNGVNPEWVQIGNETNDGMLWEEGRASKSMKNFAELITSGYNAVKAVNSGIKVIVHISNGYDNGLFRWMFDGLKNNSAKWDIIGMSLYPEQASSATNWQTYNPRCLVNMNDMVSRYGKEVMITEIGMPWSDANASFNFIADIIKKTRSVSGGKGTGVFYWEPGCYNGWSGYQKGAFDNTGKPTRAMDAFLEGATITSVTNEDLQSDILLFPNPFMSDFNLICNGNFNFKLIDMQGTELESGSGSNQLIIGKDLATGLYILKIEQGSSIRFIKITKQ